MLDQWLTVVVPTFNGERCLPEALQTLVDQQDRAPPNVIVVDDGSTDGTLAAARRFEARLPLTIVAGRHTGNWVANTNWGVELAETAYATILHQDDRWRPTRLARLRGAFERDPQAALVIHPVRVVDESGAARGTLDPPLDCCDGRLDGQIVGRRLLVQNWIACCGAAFRCEAFKSVGGLDDSLWYAADWELWLKLIDHGPVVLLPERLADLRVHAGSQTVARIHQFDEMASQLQTVWNRHRARYIGYGRRSAARLTAVSRLSLDLNGALSSWAAGRRRPLTLLGLALRFAALGPLGWRDFVRDSRIVQRVACRCPF